MLNSKTMRNLILAIFSICSTQMAIAQTTQGLSVCFEGYCNINQATSPSPGSYMICNGRQIKQLPFFNRTAFLNNEQCKLILNDPVAKKGIVIGSFTVAFNPENSQIKVTNLKTLEPNIDLNTSNKDFVEGQNGYFIKQTIIIGKR